MDMIDPASPIFGGLVASLAVEATKASVVLAIAGALVFLLRRRSASARHLVWSLAFAGVVALPALARALPTWRVALPARPAERGAGVGMKNTQPPRSQESPAEPVLVAEVREGPHEAAEAFMSPGALPGVSSDSVAEMEISVDSPDVFAYPAWGAAGVVAVWGLGVLLCGAPVVLGLLSLRRLGRSAEPETDPEMLRMLETVSARLGLNRRVRLARSQDREIPMTWGVLRPVVLLPEDATSWSSERLSVALLHELAHVKRFDFLTQLLARLVCAGYWFNPLAWLALARVRAEQEQACDDLALGVGLDPLAYADHLLAIVSGRGSAVVARTALAPGMATARSANLKQRLLGILDPARDRRAIDRRRAGFVTAIAVGLMVPLAGLSVQLGTEAVAGGTLAVTDEPPKKADEPAATPAEILAAVRENYVKPPDEAALRTGAIKGMLDALDDPHSMFVNARQLADFERQIESKIVGIGTQLEMKDGQVTVVTPLPDSPALKAGIKAGDALLEVDGKPTKGVELPDIVRQVIGAAGTVVKLKVRHTDGKTEELAITRGTITLKTVGSFYQGADGRPDYQLDPAHQVGYVRIYQFGAGTTAELMAALEALKAKGLQGLILDLRGCPGGLMSEAVDAAKVFLAKGTIVTIKGRDKAATVFTAEGEAAAPDVPLAVLVDDTTASAAEIVAGALQDNNRAVLIGTRTVGKGSVQTIVKLKDGSGALRLTSAFYELPSGRNIDKAEGMATWGIDPTDGYYVPTEPAQAELMAKKRLARERIAGVGGVKTPAGGVTPEALSGSESDPQLAAALTTMIARTTGGAFVKVGQSVSAISSRSKRLDDVRKRREALLKDLGKIDKEINELSLEKAAPAAKP